MTAICGYQHDGTAWIGADSCAANSYVRAAVRTPKLVPLSVEGLDEPRRLVLGYTTSWRFGQIVTHHLNAPRDLEDDPERYLVRVFVPALRTALSENGWLRKDSERESGGSALIAYRGGIFELQDEFSILSGLDPWAACGSGYEYALGAMSATDGDDGSDIVTQGLTAAARFAPGVMEPFHIEEVT